MNKKPGLLFAVSLLAIILLAAWFHMDFGGGAPVKLPNGVTPDSVLYVCPIGDSTWTDFSAALHRVSNYVYLFFSFAGIVLLFSWAWALYQNLLKDKFSADAYKNPWSLTKTVFWMAVIFIVLLMTPNYFRTVTVRGSKANWVLCENTSAGARAVRPNAVGLSDK